MRFHTAYGLDVTQLNIVLIDDNEHSATILRTMLNAFRVGSLRHYTKAAAALDEMKNFPPNMLLTDWKAGQADGLQLVKTVRDANAAPLCFMPIAMLTGYQSSEHEDKACKAGVTSFVRKPVSAADLYQCLADISQDRRRMVQQGSRYVIETFSPTPRRGGSTSAKSSQSASSY